jgi:hypothetical protein
MGCCSGNKFSSEIGDTKERQNTEYLEDTSFEDTESEHTPV